MCSDLTHRTYLERLDKEKHSSLIDLLINDEEKKFYEDDTRMTSFSVLAEASYLKRIKTDYSYYWLPKHWIVNPFNDQSNRLWIQWITHPPNYQFIRLSIQWMIISQKYQSTESWIQLISWFINPLDSEINGLSLKWIVHSFPRLSIWQHLL